MMCGASEMTLMSIGELQKLLFTLPHVTLCLQNFSAVTAHRNIAHKVNLSLHFASFIKGEHL